MIRDPRPCNAQCPHASVRAKRGKGCCRDIRDDDDTMLPPAPIFGGPFIPGGAFADAVPA